MHKQFLAMLALGLVLGFQFGCGGSSGGSTPPPSGSTGTVALYGGDVPACGITSLNMTFTGITLTPSTGGTPVSILSSGQSLTVDFASLMDSNAPLALASVAAGTYSQLNLTLSGAQLTYWNSTTSAPTTLTATLPSLSIALSLSPTVTVASTTPTALALDLNMLSSILVDTSSQVTGSVNPQFTLTQTAVGDNGFASIEDLRGVVSSVTTSSTQSAYTGSLVLAPATGPNLTVYVSSSTTYAGVTSLSGLTSGTFVQIAGTIDSKGNLLASAVQAEEAENASNGQAAFRGVVTSVTRSSGSATQFKLLVQEEIPDVHTLVPLQSVVTFTIASSSTTFGIASQAQSRNADFPNYIFSFGAEQVGVGQLLVVHGQVPTSGSSPVTGQARAIYFGEQPILGTLQTGGTTPLVVNGANSKIGGFGLTPCSGIYPTVFTAITGADTTFTGLTDLNSLRTAGTPLLLLKGVFLYQQSPGTVNSVTWVPPTSLQFVTGVHQLQ